MNDTRIYVFCIAVLVFQLLTGVIYVSDAYAQPAPPMQMLLSDKGVYCPNYDGVLVELVVNCFVGVDLPGNTARDGVFVAVVKRFLAAQQSYMEVIAGAAVTLAVALHGAKMALGMGGLPGLQKDTAILLLKIGGIYYFINDSEEIYITVMGVVLDFLQIVSEAASTNVCSVVPPDINLWQQFDCLLDKVIGFSGVATIVGGLLGLILAIAVSHVVGIALFLFLMGIVISLIFAVLRAVHIYIMSVLGIGFMFLLSPFFVPLILFRSTYNYFNKWLMIIFSYAMMPVVMFAFMWLAVMAMDIVLFSGKHSLFGTITGNTVNITSPTFRIGEFLQGTYFEPTDIGRQRGDVNPTEDDVTGTPQNAGIFGGDVVARAPRNQSADQYYKWVDVTGVDADALAQKAGSTNTDEYMMNFFASTVGSVLLLYVIIAMNQNVPNITRHLLTAGGGVGQLARSKVIGQQVAEAGVKTAKALNNMQAGGGATGEGAKNLLHKGRKALGI